MDFLVALFQNLIEHEDWSMSQACTDSYNKTLKKWHGWLASSSFTVMFFDLCLDNFFSRNIFIHHSECSSYFRLPADFGIV